MGCRWSPAGLFFYSTKMGTDSPSGRPRETHGTLAHGNTRAKIRSISWIIFALLALVFPCASVPCVSLGRPEGESVPILVE